jgi:translocation and assembly module TamA
MGQSRRHPQPDDRCLHDRHGSPFVTLGDGVGCADDRGRAGLSRSREATAPFWPPARRLGTLLGGDIDLIPPDYLFYSGGSGTVRGQEYQSLGAIQNGHPSGGRSFGALSAEVRQASATQSRPRPVCGRGLCRADAGFQDGDWHAGRGIGVRYDTPFGPIRVDLATPVRGNGVGEDIFSISASDRHSDASVPLRRHLLRHDCATAPCAGR